MNQFDYTWENVVKTGVLLGRNSDQFLFVNSDWDFEVSLLTSRNRWSSSEYGNDIIVCTVLIEATLVTLLDKCIILSVTILATI